MIITLMKSERKIITIQNLRFLKLEMASAANALFISDKSNKNLK